MVYCKDVNKDLKHFSYTLISDEFSHDKVSVYVFNKALLDDVSKMINFLSKTCIIGVMELALILRTDLT